jgi:predicted HTH transcriptional regulator
MATSLLDRNPRSVTFQELEDFLNEGHPESDRLDYKAEMVDTVADAMVAFANTDGGIVIAGVSEYKSTKKPDKWDGVPQNNPLGTLANYVSMLCSPTVRYEVASIENPRTKRPLVLIRVSQSLRRPHKTRERGVLTRVDDQNRPGRHRLNPPMGFVE